jgi:hypothetical protein
MLVLVALLAYLFNGTIAPNDTTSGYPDRVTTQTGVTAPAAAAVDDGTSGYPDRP